MSVYVAFVEQATLLQVTHDVLVGVLDELSGSGKPWMLYGSIQPHGMDGGQIVGTTQLHVFRAIGRGGMDYASAVLHGDVAGGDNLVGVGFVVARVEV